MSFASPKHTRVLAGTLPIPEDFELETDLQGHNNAALRDLTIQHSVAARRADDKAERHYKQMGIYLCEIRDRAKRSDKLSFSEWCRDAFISRSKAYRLIAIAEGRTTLDEIRLVHAKAMREHRMRHNTEVVGAEEANRIEEEHETAVRGILADGLRSEGGCSSREGQGAITANDNPEPKPGKPKRKLSKAERALQRDLTEARELMKNVAPEDRVQILDLMRSLAKNDRSKAA